jgi:ElaB/YqjD/DUF883 family membrane-anchored ribosome-binding protein
MASNANSIDKTLGSANDEFDAQVSKTSGLLNNAASTVSDTVQRGVSAVKGQIQTVRDHGVEGVKKDVSDYARNQPVKALLIAGGIGALAALIISRR